MSLIVVRKKAGDITQDDSNAEMISYVRLCSHSRKHTEYGSSVSLLCQIE